MALEQAVHVPRPHCPYCHDGIPFGEEPAVCPQCHAAHHAECLGELGGACGACGAPHPRFRRGAEPATSTGAEASGSPARRAQANGVKRPIGSYDLDDVLTDADVTPGETLHFTARDAAGRIESGELAADSVTKAVLALSERELTPVTLGRSPRAAQGVFLYAAADADNRRVGGWLAAPSREHAITALYAQGLLPTLVRRVAGSTDSSGLVVAFALGFLVLFGFLVLLVANS